MIKEKYSDLVPEVNSWLLPRENGMLLSDHQIDVLSQNNINYLDYKDIKSLLIRLNDVIDEDDEELDDVSKQLAEYDYYQKKD